MAATVFAEVDRVLGGAGIPVLPVKGVITGRTLYADPAERELRDVDVRIRPRDFSRALALVGRTAGWRVGHVVPAYRNITVAIGGLDVDIETSCGPPGFCGLRVEAMIERAEPGPSAQLPRMPELHDHALLLVVNAVKDHLVTTTPAALEDLRRIACEPRFCPERLRRLAEESGTLFMVHLVARFLGRQQAAWAEMDRILSRGHALRSREVDALLALIRSRGASSLAVRVATRLTPDGCLRPLRALAQAGIYELEMAATARGRSSSQSRQRSTPGSTSR
jgi:hypothetical protein